VGFWASGAGWLELSVFLERFGGMVVVGGLSYGTANSSGKVCRVEAMGG
jgi:hypothetical protein